METKSPLVVNCIFLTFRASGMTRVGVEVSRVIKIMRPDTIFVAPQDVLHEDIAKELDVKKFGRRSGLLWEQLDLPKFCRSLPGKPVLVSMMNTAPLMYRRKISMIYDIFFFRYPKMVPRKHYLFYRMLLPFVIRTSKKILTISQFSKDEIVDFFGVNPKKVEYEHLGLFETPTAASDIKNEYGRYVLFVSSIEPRKNLDRLAEAFVKLNDPGLKLVVAGGVKGQINIDYLEDIKKKNNEAINSGRIVFTGGISDEQLVSLYKNALVLAYPSTYEGFGLPPLEAMVNDCPVLVGRAASLPEVCGDAAVYVDPYDVNDIATKLKPIVDSPELRSDLKARGRKRASEFNWNKFASKVIKVADGISNGSNI